MFRVFWGPELIQQISNAYLRANPVARQAILLAIERIDAALAQNPMGAGESRESVYIRVVIVGPVAVSFRVDTGRRLVRVSSVSFLERD